MESMWMTLFVVLYLFLVGYLGCHGYRKTQTVTDYLIGGRKIHPYVMAMACGAGFISTSAMVGFGGAGFGRSGCCGVPLWPGRDMVDAESRIATARRRCAEMFWSVDAGVGARPPADCACCAV